MKPKKKFSGAVDAFGIPIPLSEDAFDRSTALQDLDNLQEPVAEHLLLLFLTKAGSGNVRGWKKELNAWRRTLSQEKKLHLPADVPDREKFKEFVFRFIDSVLSDETF